MVVKPCPMTLAGMHSATVRPLLPAPWSLPSCRPLNRILVAQRITQPQMAVGLVVAVQHVGACYLLIHKLGLSYLGAAAASCWSNLLSLALLAAYVAVTGHGESVWGRPSHEALQGWRTFAGLAYASAGGPPARPGPLAAACCWRGSAWCRPSHWEAWHA